MLDNLNEREGAAKVSQGSFDSASGSEFFHCISGSLHGAVSSCRAGIRVSVIAD